MRQKLTRNFNKTFGRGYEVSSKPPPLSHLNSINKNQLIGSVPRERFLSKNDYRASSNYLHGKIFDRTGM